MIYQLNDAIVFQTFYTVAGVGEDGLTVTVDIFRNGTSVATGQTPTDVGNGLYTFSYASTGTAGRYTAIFITSDGTVDTKQLTDSIWVGNPWVENIDAVITDIPDDVWSAADRTLTSITVSVSNDVAERVHYTLDSTVDYTNANNNALFADVNFAVQFDLTAASVFLNILYPGDPFTKEGVVVDINNAYVEMETTDLSGLSKEEELFYEFIAELATNQTIVLATGTLRII